MTSKKRLLGSIIEILPWVDEDKKKGSTYAIAIVLANENLRQSKIHQAIVQDLNGYFSVQTQPVSGLPLIKFRGEIREKRFSIHICILSEGKHNLIVHSSHGVGVFLYNHAKGGGAHLMLETS